MHTMMKQQQVQSMKQQQESQEKRSKQHMCTEYAVIKYDKCLIYY